MIVSNPRVIEIVVASNGTSRVETKGFIGTNCREASRFIEQALGNHANEVLKSEYHQTEPTQQAARHNL